MFTTSQMSVTLLQIWSAPIPFLKQALGSVDRTFSNNLNLDKATVAIIYYNEGMLAPEDAVWAALPNFADVMSSAPSVEEGLRILRRPFILPLLILGGSFGLAVDAAVNDAYDVALDVIGEDGASIAGYAAGEAAGTITEDIARNAAGEAAGNTARDVTPFVAGEAVETAVWETVEEATVEIARLPGATPESIGRAAAGFVWAIVIARQPQIQNVIETRVITENKSFDPVKIVNDLLNSDLTNVIPKARCYYLYMVSQALQAISSPLNEQEDLWTKLNEIIQEYGCSAVFAEVPAEPLTVKGLSPLTSKFGEEGEAFLRSTIGGYVGRPPTEEEVIQRLLRL